MWLYQDKEINSLEDIQEINGDIPFGFIYKVIHIPTGKGYIGKKQIFHNAKKQLGKKELAALPKTQGRPQKFKVITTESDWKKYYGSEDSIKQLIKENKQNEFTREILCFVKNKKTLSYFETKYQFINEVLEHPDKWLNSNIQGHWFTSDFLN
jgi:hypothetical protein